MTTWSDAYNFVAARVASKGLSNRDAAGLILFARKAQAKLKAAADPLDISAREAFDWYPDALLALGWAKRGDRFDMSEAWQKQPYVDSGQLMAELANLAGLLDRYHVAFHVEDPSGSAAKYKQVALDAYHLMQKLDPASADAPPATHKPHKHGPHKPKKPSDTPKPPKDSVHPVAVAPATPDATPVAPAPQTTVQPPPVVVDHPDGKQVAITPPPVRVPVVAAPPSGGVADNVPGPGASVPVQVTPPPVVAPPLVPGGEPVTVQPPPVYAQAPVVPHPDDAGQPGDWYWRKHAHDADPPPVVDTSGEAMDVSAAMEAARKKKQPPPPPPSGSGLLWVLALLALSD